MRLMLQRIQRVAHLSECADMMQQTEKSDVVRNPFYSTHTHIKNISLFVPVTLGFRVLEPEL